MKCQNCKNELPEGALFCNVCGADVLREATYAEQAGAQTTNIQADDAQSNYAVPEGFELDPSGSGQYYRYDTVTNPNTGESAQWVTWFDPVAGTYQQINCSEQEQAKPAAFMQPSTSPGPVSAKLDGYAKSSAMPPAMQAQQKSGIPRAALIAVPILVLLIGIGAALLQSGWQLSSGNIIYFDYDGGHVQSTPPATEPQDTLSLSETEPTPPPADNTESGSEEPAPTASIAGYYMCYATSIGFRGGEMVETGDVDIYYRFFEDGTVMLVEGCGTPFETVKTWLEIELVGSRFSVEHNVWDYVLPDLGSYVMEGDSVSGNFDYNSFTGTLNADGSLSLRIEYATGSVLDTDLMRIE